MNTFGIAEGIEIGLKRQISDRLTFQVSSAYYVWSSKKDLNGYQLSNGRYINGQDYYLNHIRKELSTLLPIRFGFNYLIGNSSSHPFLGAIFTLNLISYDILRPLPVADTSVPYVVSYSKFTFTDWFLSLGFDMGYSFSLSKEINAIACVRYQASKTIDYVAFVGGIEYAF